MSFIIHITSEQKTLKKKKQEIVLRASTYVPLDSKIGDSKLDHTSDCQTPDAASNSKYTRLNSSSLPPIQACSLLYVSYLYLMIKLLLFY